MENHPVIYGDKSKNGATNRRFTGWFIDRLGRVDYTFKSDGDRTIRVPFGVAKKASKLVNFILESKTPDELQARVNSDPCLKGVYVPEKVDSLIGRGKKIGSHESRKLLDEVYLTACVHMCNDNLSGMDGEGKQSYKNRALERYNAIKSKQYLEGVLDSL